MNHKSALDSPFRLRYSAPLDGIRGLAILPVVLFHANVPYCEGGYLGVDLFFVLSGFLITTLLLQEKEDTGSVNLKIFYLRRVLRLLPALSAMLIVAVTVSVYAGVLPLRQALLEALTALFYAANWTRAFGSDFPKMLGHTWSLSIEEQFYAFWPLLLLFFLGRKTSPQKLLVVCLGIALGSWALRIMLFLDGASIPRLYNGLDTRADALLIGGVLGVLCKGGLLRPPVGSGARKWASLAGAASLIFFLVMCNLSRWQSPAMYFAGFFVFDALAAVLIASLLFAWNPMLVKIFSFPPLVWLGRISYGLYLWHYPVFWIMIKKGIASWETLLFLGGGITLGMAALSFFFLERYFLRLKDRLHNRGHAPKVIA